MAKTDPILELVQAMNRAQQRGVTDDQEEFFQKIKKASQEYLDLIERQCETSGLELADIIRCHMTGIACGLESVGDGLGATLISATSIGLYLLDQTREAFLARRKKGT